MSTPVRSHGMVAGFDSAEALAEAIRRAKAEGFRDIEAYTPFPVQEVEDLLPRPNYLPVLVLGAGVAGHLAGWLLQEYIAVWHYPLNIGGRPLNSWPSFVVVAFELTVLFAASAAFFGTLILSGLPKPYHPLSNAERFTAASTERFVLYVRARDRHYHPERTAAFLRGLQPEGVEEVIG